MTIFDEMVAAYNPQNAIQKTNAQHQVMQQIVLAGLQKGGFFEHAAFYGGTCLRIFHGLPRFSEDMDFTLVDKNPAIHLENYFQPIREVFALTGKDVVITKKEKLHFGRVESAFLKEDTAAYDIVFQTEKTIKVKIELDSSAFRYGAETDDATVLDHDTLFDLAGLICRKDARFGFS